MPDFKVNDKLKSVLYKFLEPNYSITDDMYLEKLLLHFREEDKISVFTEWIFYVLEKWKETPRQPSLGAFVLRILGLIVSEKKRFKLMQKENVIPRIIDLMNIRYNSNLSMKLGYVAMLSSLVNHEYGCDYLSESETWKDVVNYYYEDTSIYISRECQKFISTYINTVIDDNPAVCENVINYTLKTLLVSDEVLKTTLKDTNGVAKFKPVIEMANHLYETLLFDPHICATSMILEKFDLEMIAWKLLDGTEDMLLTSILSRLLTSLYFVSMQCKNKSGEITHSDFKLFESKLYNLLGFIIPKSGKFSLNILVQSQIYWYKLSPTVLYEPERNSKQYIFENQLIILQLMPVLGSIVTTRISENECLDSYCNKLFELTCESIQRLCYVFRDSIVAQDNRPESLHTGVLSLMQIKDIIHRDQAIIMFQALMYILKDFVPELDPHPPMQYSGLSSDEILILYPEVLSSILETLSSLIDCFRINWRESLESICLFTFMNQLLKNPHLSSKLAVKTLKLMQEVIQNFMPPNLALLVNTLEGSTINQLGPLLFKRMHDVSWEVRDSALEVLRIVTTIAEIKFTAFQDHILENELCALCVSMAVDDLESYVRATALSCLCAMVRVEKFWAQSLSLQNLPGKMINTLKFESEGIVRREAAALMKELFEHHKIPKSVMDEVFKTMVIAAVKDLHWEVQVNALDFWQKVIEQQMSNQGMIDGVFPSVTFSKENRKIVTLTAKEIKVRLGKVLEELARLGCLQVLLTTIEDCNHQVVTKAVLIVQYISKLLSQHGVLSSPSEEKDKKILPDVVSSSCKKSDISVPQCVPVLDTFGADYSESYRPAQKVARLVRNGEIESSYAVPSHDNSEMCFNSSDQVIDAIVKESDISLLQRVYQDQLNINDQEERKMVSKCITSEEFLAKLSEINLTKHVASRSEWLDYCCDDLSSLLDDILASSIGRESNAVDCY
ncbi:Uncharacterized protein GBIM_17360 [Gryllus bimaculatus]|nr:Uncharacterized protein GBIM_17360 [Gryllus bimaculatus]